MPKLQNTYKRGAVYCWRRDFLLRKETRDPITHSVRLSLRTKEVAEARHRTAALTSKGEAVRMSVCQQVRTNGIPVEVQQSIFDTAMRQHRDLIVDLLAEADMGLCRLPNSPNSFCADQVLTAEAEFWELLQKTGLKSEGEHYLRELVARLPVDPAELVSLRYARKNDAAEELRSAACGFLDRFGLEASEKNLAVLIRMIMAARAKAARDAQTGTVTWLAEQPAPLQSLPEARVLSDRPAVNCTAAVGLFSEVSDPKLLRWRDALASAAAALLIEDAPRMSSARRGGKREQKSVGEQTLRQIRFAAELLDRSTGGKPFWQVTDDDLRRLDDWFDRLPTNIGRSEKDRPANASFEAIIERAEGKIERGQLPADAIGLTYVTTNKHFRMTGKIHANMRRDLKQVTALSIGDFIVPDRKDERAGREAYTWSRGASFFNYPSGPAAPARRIDCCQATSSTTTVFFSCSPYSGTAGCAEQNGALGIFLLLRQMSSRPKRKKPSLLQLGRFLHGLQVAQERGRFNSTI